MSTEPKDGGPAFPNIESPDNPYASSGMTLRDYFAGQAIQGLLAGDYPGKVWPDGGASREAYELADAMLAERAKKTP